MPWRMAAQFSKVLYFCSVLWSGLYIQCASAQERRLHSNPNIDVHWYNDATCTTEIAPPNVGILWNKESDGGTCKDITSHLSNSNPVVMDTRGYNMGCPADYGLLGSYSVTTILVRIQREGCGLCTGATLNCDQYYQASAAHACTQYQGDIEIYMEWDYPSGGSSICGEAVPTHAHASVVGDPVTWFGDRREEFELPIGAYSTLIRSPDMQVLARSRQGHAKDQWIDRIVIADSSSDIVLDVAIKMNLTRFHRASLLPDAFETMDVKMEWWRRGLIEIMPPGDAQFTHWSGLSLGFGRVRHYGQETGAAPRREAVIVQSKSLKILIISSAAREYFPEEASLGVEYSHLDIEVMEMKDEKQLEGILPELWGLRPMSEQTMLLRKEPEIETAENISNVSGNATICSSLPSPEDNNVPIYMTSEMQEKCADASPEQIKVAAVASVEGLSGTIASLSEGNVALGNSDSAADI